MDFASVSAAVALLAILLGWYALLEYEDRLREKNARGAKRPPEGDGRGENRARERRPGEYVTRLPGRPNGHPASGQSSSPALAGRGLMFGESYELAVAGVLAAYLIVALGNLLFSFPPFIFFAAAVALAFALVGRGPGLVALLAATLLSDFFFVEPAFTFSMDWQVFRLCLVYLLAGLLSLFMTRRSSSGASV